MLGQERPFLAWEEGLGVISGAEWRFVRSSQKSLTLFFFVSAVSPFLTDHLRSITEKCLER